MKKNTLDLKLVFYLVCVTLLCVFKIYFTYYSCNGFAFADWLINYQEAGFNRRGLLGTIFVFLYQSFSIKLQYSVFFVQALVHILFFYFLYLLVKVKQTGIVEIFFLLTPFCLWGLFSDAAIGSRKDGILWLLFVVYAYLLAQNKLSKSREYFMLVFFGLSVLVHESFIFYAQYFLIILYFHERKVNLRKYILILLSFYIPAGIILIFGNLNIDYSHTLKMIQECNIDLQSDNVFQWKETQLIKTDIYVKEIKNISLYLISFALQLFFVIFYMRLKSFTAQDKKKLLVALMGAVIISIPLFLIAIDTGRWLYNHFILFSILLISLLPKRSENVKFFDITIIKDNKVLLFIILVVIADFSYRVPSYLVGMQLGLPLRFFLNFF